MTNREFAKTNPQFRRACDLAAVTPTTRQASKFRNEFGSAFPFKARAEREVAEEAKEANS